MMAPLKVSQSMKGAQRRGSVKVLVQPEKDSLEAMAKESFSSRFGEDLEEEFGAAAVQFHIAELIDAEQVDAAVAGDGLGQHLFVGGFDGFVYEPGGQGVFDPVTLLRRGGAEADEQVGFSGSGVPDQALGCTFADPVRGRVGVDGGGVDVRVRVEIKIPEPFVPRKVRCFDPADRGAVQALSVLPRTMRSQGKFTRRGALAGE
jgi:hypothetical protein